MYLEKIVIKNFRKFYKDNNQVVFYNKNIEGNEIDISNVSTLIVGQNNAGKSSVFKAFDLLISNGNFNSKDFNYEYLKEYVEKIINGKIDEETNDIICPMIEFELIIDLSDNENENITQALSLINIESIDSNNKGLLRVVVKLKDENIFKKHINNYIVDFNGKKNKYDNNILKRELLNDICNEIDEIGTIVNFYNSEKKIDFKFSDLFNFKLIDALSVDDECVLSKQFKSILKYHFSKGNIELTDDMKCDINELNHKVCELLDDRPANFINDVISSIVSNNRIMMELQGKITFESILDYCVKYYYSEGEFSVPEDHYGLGYTKLVSIVANLLDYVERKPEKELDNKISIIAIEEPETFMHPQLQKCFIKNINDVLNKILNSDDKKIKCQLVISTHSPHIVSNKIELSNSISNINYFGVHKNKTQIVLLEDKMFETDNNIPFNNIKKHMSLELAEALFADAIIFVEGFAEDKMIPYFLSNYDDLRNRYLSIVNIRGAHGYVYEKLISALKVPSVIITDVDFKISDKTKDNQISSYTKQKTTNETVAKYNGGSYSLDLLSSCELSISTIPNLRVFIQECENSYCGTSFEEALILANFDNDIISKALIETYPRKIKKILEFDDNNIKRNSDIKDKSKQIYNLISNKKAEFTLNTLKYILESEEELKTPSYIIKAFNFLAKEVENNA